MTDKRIAELYVSKCQHARKEGHEWNLSLFSFMNLMRAKRCKYTGIFMTENRAGKNQRRSDVSIDRVDRTKPYESGNVVACCYQANKFKGQMESPSFHIKMKNVIKMCKLVVK